MITTIVLTGPNDEVKMFIEFIRKLDNSEQPSYTMNKKDGILLIFQNYESAKKAFTKAKDFVKSIINFKPVLSGGNWLDFGSSKAEINR